MIELIAAIVVALIIFAILKRLVVPIIILLAIVLIYSYAHSEDRWYVAHYGSETCVPLDDVDPDSGQRLYYGTGDLHTPADLRSWFKSMGGSVGDIPDWKNTDDSVAFTVTVQGKTNYMLLTTDLDKCRAVMNGLSDQR